MYTCNFMYSSTHVRECTCVWRVEVDTECLSRSPLILFIDAGSFVKFRAQHFCSSCCPGCSGYSVPTACVLRLHKTTKPGDPNSSPHSHCSEQSQTIYPRVAILSQPSDPAFSVPVLQASPPCWARSSFGLIQFCLDL